MIRNNDDHFDDDNGLLLDVDASPAGKNQRHEPKFSGFDENDEHDYEESDRDTDHASGYHADELEEEEEEQEEAEEFDDTLLDAGADEGEDEDELDLFPDMNTGERNESARSGAEEPDAWLEKEGYLDDEEQADGQGWPLSLIAVGLVALVLLIAGGYGVMQQRAATQEELAQLRATLATSGNPEEMRSTRNALQELKASYDKLAANAEALTLENRRLTDTVAGLEAQLGVQQSVLTKALPAKQEQSPTASAVTASSQAPAQGVVSDPVSMTVASGSATASPKPAAVQPATAESPAAQPPTTNPAIQNPAAANPEIAQSAVASPSGPWFVNFGSYAARSMAESWAARLHPRAGKVIIAPNASDGKTLYRLRVVGLASKNVADEVARNLQAELQVSQLWVGRE